MLAKPQGFPRKLGGRSAPALTQRLRSEQTKVSAERVGDEGNGASELRGLRRHRV